MATKKTPGLDDLSHAIPEDLRLPSLDWKVTPISFASSSCSPLRRHRFELIFENFDVSRSRPLPNPDAVNSGTVRTQGTAEFNDPGSHITGIANLDKRAKLEGLGQFLRRHRQVPPTCSSPRGRTEDAEQ